MIYSNAEDMIKMIHNQVTDYDYIAPNRDMLTISYWVLKINQKINSLK
jgi:hypothetical protein